MKICSRCGKKKQMSDFYKDKRSKNGFYSHCKVCHREANRQSYRKHRQKRLAHIKDYVVQNREAVLHRQYEWVRKNPDKVKAARHRYYTSEKGKKYFKEYRRKNLEKRRKYDREWKRKYRATQVEKSRQYEREYRKRPDANLTDKACAQRKRARKSNAPGKFTKDDIIKQYAKQDGSCFWCQTELGDDYHIDHYIPLSRGGTNYPDNIVLACPTCNVRRNNKMPSETISYLSNHPD